MLSKSGVKNCKDKSAFRKLEVIRFAPIRLNSGSEFMWFDILFQLQRRYINKLCYKKSKVKESKNFWKILFVLIRKVCSKGYFISSLKNTQ